MENEAWYRWVGECKEWSVERRNRAYNVISSRRCEKFRPWRTKIPAIYYNSSVPLFSVFQIWRTTIVAIDTSQALWEKSTNESIDTLPEHFNTILGTVHPLIRFVQCIHCNPLAANPR